jgi:predicted phage terminase large subunit-like protein
MAQLSADEIRYFQALKRRKTSLTAKTSLIGFARAMHPDPDHPDDADFSLYKPALHQEVIAAALEEVEAGRLKRLIINCPPRHGKSELASRLFPPWFLGKHPRDSIISASYNEKFSWDFGREVKNTIEDPIFRQIFPDIAITTASVDRIEVETGGKVFFTGRGGSITGRGAIGLILDDPIKDRTEADSPTVREKVWKWYTQVMRSRLVTSKGWIIIIQTRWHEDDLVGRLTDKTNPSYVLTEAKKWSIIDLPALARDNDPIGRKPGTALWPERFPVEYLEDMREGDPRGFQSLYQGSPTPEAGNFFPGDCVMTYGKNEMPPREELRFYAASDHAVSIAQDRDKTCAGVVGVDKDQNLWVMPKLVWGRYSTDQVVERMIDLMADYKPLYWWAEKGHISKSIGPFLRKRMLERSTFCSVVEVTPTHDKKTRAQAINGRMAMRMVFFPSFAPWWAEARDELLKFPYGTHDDFVDFLSWIGLGLGIFVPNKKPKPAFAGPRPGTLGWVKKSAREGGKRPGLPGGW